MAKTRNQSKQEEKENKPLESHQKYSSPTIVRSRKINKKLEPSQSSKPSNSHVLQNSISIQRKKDTVTKKKQTFTCKPMRVLIKRLTIDELKELTSVKPVKEYNLRIRKPTQNEEKKSKITNDKRIVKKDRIVPISTLFEICKKKESSIEKNQIVLAKMSTYSPWPAKVIEIINDKKVKVFFFGTSNHGFVNLIDCVDVRSCGPVICRLLNSKQTSYKKAVREMEISIGLTGSALR